MMTRKKISVLVCSFVLAVCLGFCIGTNLMSVRADAHTTLSSFSMEKGSAVKIVEDATKSGMKFQMTISNEDYKSLSGYDVKFGMFIAPKNYVVNDEHDFTVANLFENGAIYYWDDNVIEGIGTLTSPAVNPTLNNTLAENNAEIWHLTPAMTEKADYKLFEGSIVNFAENSTYLVKEYVCRGYVQITDNGNTTYVMANYFGGERANNTRSMAFVAQAEVETLSLIPIEDRTESQSKEITTLQSGYITPIQGFATTYNVECYAVNGNTLLETYSVAGEIGADVVVTPKTIAGKVFDSENAGNVLSGKVGISGTTFKAYYNDAPALAVPSVFEVACQASGTVEFDLTRIINVDNQYIEGTVVDSNDQPVTITNNKINVASGDRFVFTNNYGQSVVIRGNSRTNGLVVDFTTMTDAELLTITNSTYKDATDTQQPSNQAVASNAEVNTFSVCFNTDGIVPNTVVRTLTFVVHNYSDPDASNLKLQATDKSGNFTFAERDIPLKGWQASKFTMYMPVGMNLSDLVLTLNDLNGSFVKIYDIYVQEFTGTNLMTLTFDTNKDKQYFTQCGADTMPVENDNFVEGEWFRQWFGYNFALRLNVLLPEEIIKTTGIRFSVDMNTQTGGHYLAAKVGDETQTLTGYQYNNAFHTFTFDVSLDPNFLFEFFVDNQHAKIHIDNIKVDFFHKHFEDVDYEYEIQYNNNGTHSTVYKCCGEVLETVDCSFNYEHINDTDTHTATCSICKHSEVQNCSGGVATEEEPATCQYCEEHYGKKLDHQHSFYQKVDAKYLVSEATCTSPAIYHESCSKCGFEGTTTFTNGDTLPHTYQNYARQENGQYAAICSGCNDAIVINGAPIREVACASGTTTFDLTTITYGGVYVAGTVKDSANNQVAIKDNTITVSAGGRYVFTNVYGDTIIIANNKAGGKVVNFATMTDAELLTITNSTYKDATDETPSNKAVASNTGVATFSVGFNTDGIVPNTVVRTLTFVVHNYSDPPASNLKLQAIDKSGNFTFAERDIPLNGWQASKFTMYMPVGMNLSDLELTLNGVSGAFVKVYDIYVQEFTGTNLMTLTFDTKNDKQYFTQCGADTMPVTNDNFVSGEWFRSWSGYNFALRLNVLLPEEIIKTTGIRFSVDMKTQDGGHYLAAKVGDETQTLTGDQYNNAFHTFTFDVSLDPNFLFEFFVDNQHAKIHIDNIKVDFFEKDFTDVE